MNNLFTKKFFIDYSFILIGSILYGIAVSCFALPNKLSEGGIIGVSILLEYLFKIETSISNFVLNAILIIVGLWYLPKRVIFRTAVTVALSSLFIYLFHDTTPAMESKILAGMAAGLLLGAGIGCIFRGDSTTAGTSIIAKILEKKFSIKKSTTILATDLMVIFPSAFVIGLESTLITLIAVFLGAKAIDFVVEGAKPRKNVLIISDKHEEISKLIHEKLNRSMTLMDGIGYKYKQKHTIIYVVIENNQMMTLANIVQELDPDAFMVTSDTFNVFGNKFSK